MYPSHMPEKSLIPCSSASAQREIVYPVPVRVKAKALLRVAAIKPMLWLMKTERGGWLRLFMGTGGLAWLIGLALAGATLTFANTLPVVIGSAGLLSLIGQAAKDTMDLARSFFKYQIDEEVARIQAEDRGEIFSEEDFDDLGYWGR